MLPPHLMERRRKKGMPHMAAPLVAANIMKRGEEGRMPLHTSSLVRPLLPLGGRPIQWGDSLRREGRVLGPFYRFLIRVR